MAKTPDKQDISDEFADVIGEMDDKTKQLLLEMNKYIMDNPRKSALYGLGAGLLLSVILGFLFRRKN